ncbi:hypothetical protein [Hymenobacter elongatus]|uniref:Uncharacterized protein n=1 Tax=Hymenobacter elongatus TaxID=877208 RepID=A0A4Z0PII8_9BACT|nr:hypothetical protein [Hymenobacter elongatus]TGE14584.1 hypothetical protein E5J99_15620 [Hymenobacter elongatus]
MKHFSFLFFLLFLLARTTAYSQQAGAVVESVGPYTSLVDSLISNLDKTRVPTGILYDRVAGLSSLDDFTASSSSSAGHFFQRYYDLSTAAYSKPTAMFPYTQTEIHATAEQQIRGGQLPLGVLDVRFAVLDTLAEDRGTIVESGGLSTVLAPRTRYASCA